MSQRFAVVHEAEADFRTATELADRVLVETIDWLDDDQLAHQREWVGELVGARRLTWTNIARLARQAGIPVRGPFDGEPAQPDARAARRAIRYLLFADPDLKAVLLIRDQDDQPERRDGLEQARNEDKSGIEIVVGLAVVERECWVVSGFEPQDATESSRLEAQTTTLGFDPRTQSHQLTACKNDQATRSPKRVLRALLGNDPHRERRCWTEPSLELLRERGSANGLADYLKEIRDRLARLIGHVPT